MYSIMRATSFSVFNCKVFLPSLNKVIYLFIYLFMHYAASPQALEILRERATICQSLQLSVTFNLDSDSEYYYYDSRIQICVKFSFAFYISWRYS